MFSLALNTIATNTQSTANTRDIFHKQMSGSSFGHGQILEDDEEEHQQQHDLNEANYPYNINSVISSTTSGSQSNVNFDDIFQFNMGIPDYTHRQLNNNTSHTPTVPQMRPLQGKMFKNLNEQLQLQQERYESIQNELDSPTRESEMEQDCIPPSKTVFDTLDEGKEFLKTYMKEAKIGLVICDSRKNSYTSYRCDRGGNYRDRRNIDNNTRIRKLRTRKCNCQFKLMLKLNKLDQKWHIILKNLKHNHSLTNLENLPILRRRDSHIKNEIKMLLDSGIKNPTQIKNFLVTKYQGIVITKRDIYNEIGEYMRKSKTGTPSTSSAKDEPDDN